MTTSTGRDHNRIQLVFRGRREEAPNHDATLKPGMLACILETDRIAKHVVEGSGGETLIVDLDAKRDGMTVDGVYDGAQDTEVVPYLIPLPGDVLNVLLQEDEVAEKGLGLSSNGDGTFKVATDGDQQMFIAWETLTATGADTLIKARCISTHENTGDSI